MAKILEEEEEEDDRVGQAPAHTYSSSSYSLGGQTAMTRSIQSCGGKLCDSGMLGGHGVSALPLRSHAGHHGPGPPSWGLLPLGRWAQVGLEVLLVGRTLTVQSFSLGKLPVSEVSEPQRPELPGP